MKMYMHLAREIGRLQRVSKPGSGFADGFPSQIHEALDKLVKDRFPSGSGFDAGTKLDIDNAKPNRYVFHTSFHHMDDHGSYCGWSEHTVVVTADMQFGFSARVTGPNYRDIKDYIGETFDHCLNQEVLG